MEPETRYVRTADGVNVAYWTLGSGPPLLYLPPMPQHVQLDWRYAPMRDLYLWLSRNHLLVRFDQRASGLSQRDVTDTSLEGQLADIEAVVERVGIEEYDVFAHGSSASLGVVHAARSPKAVRKLVMVSPFAPFAETYAHPPIRALSALLPLDHTVWSEFLAYVTSGWQGGEHARQYAALMRASMSQEQRIRSTENTREAMEALHRHLPAVQSPTLIIYQRDAVAVPASSPQRLAAEIADARLMAIEGEAVTNPQADPLMLAAVDEFLLGRTSGAAAAGLPAGTAVILFVDIESSTALTERMGDAAFRGAARAIDQRVREAVRAAGGTPVEGKVMGDGVMSVFSSAAQAIAGAHACRELSAESELRLHIGLHAGDVIREGSNVYGGAVNIASRICDASPPGEILVSATVRDLARTSAGVTFEDRGERALKGIADPVRVFAVQPGGEHLPR